MTDTQREFAYGANSADGCPCPATAAGYNPSTDKTVNLAEEYDYILQDTRSESGTVDEQTAKEAWLEAIDYWDRRLEQTRNERQRELYERYIVLGEEIADELGWL